MMDRKLLERLRETYKKNPVCKIFQYIEHCLKGKVNMNGIYETKFLIESTRVNSNGDLGMVGLFEIIQDTCAAGSQYNGFGINDLLKRNLAWVVLRQRVEIIRLPRLDEEISVCTYPGKIYRSMLYFRHVIAKDKDGNILFRYISQWAILDTKNREITLSSNTGIAPEETALDEQLESMGSVRVDDYDLFEIRKVRNTDVDFNGHMNNIRYIAYVVDTIKPEDIKDKKALAIQADYKHELKLGDQVELHVNKGDSYKCYGSVDGQKCFCVEIEYAEKQ